MMKYFKVSFMYTVFVTEGDACLSRYKEKGCSASNLGVPKEPGGLHETSGTQVTKTKDSVTFFSSIKKHLVHHGPSTAS